MDEYSVDFSGVTDKETLHHRLREALPLPQWYGNNLDALYDSLTDLPVPLTIRFLNWKETRDRMDGYFENFRRVLRDTQEDLPGLVVLFEDPCPGNPAEDLVEAVYEEQKDASCHENPAEDMVEEICEEQKDAEGHNSFSEESTVGPEEIIWKKTGH